jgi:hypothetical protein
MSSSMDATHMRVTDGHVAKNMRMTAGSVPLFTMSSTAFAITALI